MALSLSGTTGIVTSNIAALQVTTATIADNNVTPGKLSQPMTLATAQNATGSNTFFDFTGIPSWAKRITVMFKGVSTNGASTPWLIQIGDSGGIENTNYLATSSRMTASATGTVASTAGFPLAVDNSATNVCHGSMTITLFDLSTNSWVASGVFANSNYTESNTVAGSKSLSATLDRVRITTTNGTDAFDAGSINIMYEG
jgi:hypothetical protein